jgi:pimeloyl-ACP methyl ester carboxylesterase
MKTFDLQDGLLRCLSHEWSGLAIAATVVVVGLSILTAVTQSWLAQISLCLAAVGALLGFGALRHWLHTARVDRRHPAPGQMINMGCWRMHILAEGEAEGRPTVVWIPGGHAGGLALHHLHLAMREETRSILFDRAGSGWSDAGPFPRSTVCEAEEAWRCLESAGERGPIILVGHSLGGLLAANMARRHREHVCALVLLDATPLDTITYGPALMGMANLRRQALFTGMLALFGIYLRTAERAAHSNPEIAEIQRVVHKALGPSASVLREIETNARAQFALASMYAEHSPARLTRTAWQTVVYDGDLGDLPVWVVAPGDSAETASLPPGIASDPNDLTRMHRFYRRNRERYLETSTQSHRVQVPAGCGHNFPYEVPEFVIDLVRDILLSTSHSAQ